MQKSPPVEHWRAFLLCGYDVRLPISSRVPIVRGETTAAPLGSRVVLRAFWLDRLGHSTLPGVQR